MGEEVDAEIVAMGAIAKALAPLSEEERGRVIRWAGERFGVTISNPRSAKVTVVESNLDDATQEDEDRGSESVKWEHFADLYDAAGPTMNPNRLLVAAYWTQYVEGRTAFGSLELNKLLKDLGHGVTDTSHVMDSLIEQKPALILQLKKSGKSRQARKTYKVTGAGQKAIDQMIAANGT